jgi:DeoR/GlpR family transcriptional regulator of sugar metabolism
VVDHVRVASDLDGVARFRPPLPAERRRLIAQQVADEGHVTVEELASHFGVSVMTVRRDLAVLGTGGQVRRVHGGALVPDLSAHEDSFSFRLEASVEAKQRLAEAALEKLHVGESVFLDGSSTSYFAAKLIVARDYEVTVLTNSLPLMALFNTNVTRHTALFAIGGSLRDLTLAFGGPAASESVRRYVADKAIISCKGVTEDGLVTEPAPNEIDVKKAMLAHSQEPLLLLDGSKFEQRGLYVVDSVTAFSRVLVAGAPPARVAQLRRLGVEVEVV